MTQGQSIVLTASVGAALLGVGAATSLVATIWASLPASALAAILLVWAVTGIVLSLRMRPAPEWSTAATAFGAMAMIAAALLLAGEVDIEWLTLLAVFGLLCEGVFSAIHGLRLQACRHNGGTACLLNGGMALALGLLVLWPWPDTAGRFLEFVLALDFGKLGLTLLLIALADRRQ
jgi:uncharacterized membrane protein HdeD (DUF308 family)